MNYQHWDMNHSMNHSFSIKPPNWMVHILKTAEVWPRVRLSSSVAKFHSFGRLVGEASGGYFSVFMRIPCMMIIMDIMPVITWLVVWNMNGGLEHEWWFGIPTWKANNNSHVNNKALIRITIITWLVVWNMNGLWLSIQLGLSSSQLANSMIFQRGGSTTNQS